MTLRKSWIRSDCQVLNKQRGRCFKSKIRSGFNSWMYGDSRMTGLDLSGELVRLF